MEWEFYAEADTSNMSSRPWYPTNVYLYKKLVDTDGNIITYTQTDVATAIASCADLPSLANSYLSAVRSHFDAQYDLIYTGRDEPHPSVCFAFGKNLAGCISIYRALLTGDLGEV
jgi:hypothetical protein